MKETLQKVDDGIVFGRMPSRAQSVMQANASVRKHLRPEEYELVMLTNQYRVMMGKSALKINVKLCLAGRDHSKDMKENNFFSHDSPIPGKESPGKRAMRFGTSCGSENIAQAGSAEGAFWGWFSSLGHHRNMLSAGHQIGIGHHGGYWTEGF